MAKKRKAVRTVYTEPLYTYAQPVNADWVRKAASKKGKSYSAFIDDLIVDARLRGARGASATGRRAK